MNKKGFTLVEMIGVIVLLVAIALIVYPMVTNVIKKQKEKALAIQTKKIDEAFDLYAQDNCNTKTCDITVSVNKLKDEGYIQDEDIINPVTNESLNICYHIKFNEATNKIEKEKISLDIESAHNYANNLTGDVEGLSLWTTTISNAKSISVNFNSLSTLDYYRDYLYIYDGSGNLIQKLSYTNMSGEKYIVSGNTVIIKLMSDGGDSRYGFKATLDPSY